MKNTIFLFVSILFAFSIAACKKNTKPLAGIDYYIQNTFEDSVKLNMRYIDYQDIDGTRLPDSTLTLLRLKGKERRFIVSAQPRPYGGFEAKHPLLPSNPYNARLYGVRANGDTIRPKLFAGGSSAYGDNGSSLAFIIYWKKEINEETGAAVYTLELH